MNLKLPPSTGKSRELVFALIQFLFFSNWEDINSETYTLPAVWHLVAWSPFLNSLYVPGNRLEMFKDWNDLGLEV